MNLLAQMLQPQTEGFGFINLDIAFTDLDLWDLQRVEILGRCITICDFWGLKQSSYIKRSELATLLNSRRSRKGKSMDLFTTTITKAEQTQTYSDETKKKGLSLWNFGKGGGN